MSLHHLAIVAALSAMTIIPPAWAGRGADLNRTEQAALETLSDLAFASSCGIFTQPQAVAASVPIYHSLMNMRREEGLDLESMNLWMNIEVHRGQLLAREQGACHYWSDHPDTLARLDRLVIDAMNGKG